MIINLQEVALWSYTQTKVEKKMLSIVIIEDDPLSLDLLKSTLHNIDHDIEVVATVGSVKDGISFFRKHPTVDLILSDVQLSDGLSFTIFEQVEINCPVIFISSYDNYIINAFEYRGIDYLLKPVSDEGLSQALSKYKAFQSHFTNKNHLVKDFVDEYVAKKKTRIIVKKGYNFISLLLTDVVLFYTENLVVYAVDSGGNKYMVDKNLNSLEEELNPGMFFRANRQYIININFIMGYKSYERVKLLLSLKKNLEHVIVVGQEKAKAFRKWLAEG